MNEYISKMLLIICLLCFANLCVNVYSVVSEWKDKPVYVDYEPMYPGDTDINREEVE